MSVTTAKQLRIGCRLASHVYLFIYYV